MSEGPLVTVVIPVKDGARFLREAIDSVLSQSHPRIEVVVVDGGSTDGSTEIAGSYEAVTLIAQEGTGIGGAWNEGVEAGSGELIALLDSDDRWLPGKLEAQVAMLGDDPALDAVIGGVRHFLEPGHAIPPGFRPELLESEESARMPGAILFRRSMWEEVGAFDTGYDIATDVEWFFRLNDAGVRIGIVPEVVIEKRIHDSNLSLSDIEHNNRELLRVMRESVARKRSSG